MLDATTGIRLDAAMKTARDAIDTGHALTGYHLDRGDYKQASLSRDLARLGRDIERAAIARRVERQRANLNGKMPNAPRGGVKSKALGRGLRTLA